MEQTDIHQMLQTAGQYLYIALAAIRSYIQLGWAAFTEWLAALPLPNAIKLFSNNTLNKYLFFGVLAFILIMNIWAFTLFVTDKSVARHQSKSDGKRQRVSEKKLFRVCFWGGAAGGLIGMNMFHHKTKKRKFTIGIPILFVWQMILHSFMLGFLGFWTFF